MTSRNTSRWLITLTCVLLAPAAFAVAPPAPDVLTEGNAALWGADAASSTSAVYNDTSRRQVGSSSLRYETGGCFDTRLWAPAARNAGWDLLASGSGGVGFWIYAENPSPHGFQGNFPVVRLGTTEGDYYEFRPVRSYLNDARGQWVYCTVPLNGSADWTPVVVGNPSLAEVNFIQFHADTWDCGFTVWYDGLTFDVPLAPPQGLRAIAGNGQVRLRWQPYSDLGGMFSHYAIYRGTSAFTSTVGRTHIATVNGLNNTTFTDTTAVNGVRYHYAVAAVFTSGGATTAVQSVGPRTPRSETDLQVTQLSRTPRYPRYTPTYTYYTVTEPSGFGPYIFSAATGLSGGQTGSTQRWPNVGDPVTYTATIRNRGTNPWAGTLGGTWTLDGAVIGTPSRTVNLQPGDTTTLAVVVPWDDELHDLVFTLNVSDARPANNVRAINTKSVPFLTYVDESFLEDFREVSTPAYPQAATDDLLDWLWRHADEMNAMAAEAGSGKRVHYDVLEVLADGSPLPGLNRTPFGIFPLRYEAGNYSNPRATGYYHANVDIDYGLCHELAHQLGLIDIYQLNAGASQNQVNNQGYSAVSCLMNGVSPYYSEFSAGAMDAWLHSVHGYYGQYLYDMPDHVELRILDYLGRPLPGATLTYQKAERPGQGQVITSQVKAVGVTDAAGIWRLPNVPIDGNLVPPTHAGDVLRDNPFGYVAVVGTNGLLLFKIEYEGFIDYAWLDITEVNVAYWQGATSVATFDRQVAIGGGVQYFPPLDMTELNAADWTAWSQDGEVTLSDDLSRKRVGAGSVKFVTTGGFDNYVRYPVGLLARWDLSDVQSIRFWVYSQNPNGGYQNNSPWVRLGNFADGYFEWRPSSEVLNTANNQWREFVVPIAGSSTWTRTVNPAPGSPGPSLGEINYIQMHADTWGYGFTLWLDGVRFDPPPMPPLGDLNCDGAVDTADIDAFVLALVDPVGYAAVFPGCDIMLADMNGDGAVDTADIDGFVAAIIGG